MLCRKCKKEIPIDALLCCYCGAKVNPKRGGRQRGNGQGSAYKRGSTWTAVVTMGYRMGLGENGKEHLIPIKRAKGGFKTKNEALSYCPTLRGERQKTTTLAKLYDTWSENELVLLSKSKQTAYRIAYEKIKKIVDTDIAELDIETIREAVKNKAKTHYTVRDIKTLLSHLFNLAVAQQYITTNLAEYITLPKLDESEQTPFSESEILKFWSDYTDGNIWTGYILLMIYSGMMPGELLAAKKDMIDWSNQQIVGAGLKTKERKKIPLVIPDLVVPVLADLCAFSKGQKIITQNKDNFYAEYYATLERLGCQKLPPYSCRHTTATACALDGILPSVIQKIMRHTRFSTTERYIHVDTGPMLEALNRVIANRSK